MAVDFFSSALGLKHCKQITDAGLASLTAGCPAITTLHLSGCNEIMDIGLTRYRHYKLIEGCTPLCVGQLGHSCTSDFPTTQHLRGWVTFAAWQP